MVNLNSVLVCEDLQTACQTKCLYYQDGRFGLDEDESVFPCLDWLLNELFWERSYDLLEMAGIHWDLDGYEYFRNQDKIGQKVTHILSDSVSLSVPKVRRLADNLYYLHRCIDSQVFDYGFRFHGWSKLEKSVQELLHSKPKEVLSAAVDSCSQAGMKQRVASPTVDLSGLNEPELEEKLRELRDSSRAINRLKVSLTGHECGTLLGQVAFHHLELASLEVTANESEYRIDQGGLYVMRDMIEASQLQVSERFQLTWDWGMLQGS